MSVASSADLYTGGTVMAIWVQGICNDVVVICDVSQVIVPYNPTNLDPPFALNFSEYLVSFEL